MDSLKLLIKNYEKCLLLILFPEGHTEKTSFSSVFFLSQGKAAPQQQTVQYNFISKAWTIEPLGTRGTGLLDLWMIHRQKTFNESEEEILRLLGEWPKKESSETSSHKNPPLNFKQVAQASLVDSLSIAQSLLPNGKRQGSEYVALNPKRADKKLGSFRINLETGRWADFAIGEKGGDLISLWAYLKGTSQFKAAQELGARCNLL